ncbi:M36 family metallopeptidase [Pontimicrobium sp. MEBiC06410]
MKNSYKLFLLLIFAVQSSFSQRQVKNVVQNHFNSISEVSEAKKMDLAEWKITDVVPSLNPNIQHVYVQQYHNNIPIQFAGYKLTIKNNQVTWEINQFVSDISSKANAAIPSITPEDAILKTINKHRLKNPTLKGVKNENGIYEYKNSGISSEPIKVKLLYQKYNERLRLVWNVNLYQKNGEHWWSENIDANTGQILYTEDWVVSCNFGDPNHKNHDHNNESISTVEKTDLFLREEKTTTEFVVGGGSYNVYPLGIESPNHGSRTIVTDPANAIASPFGWHDTNGSAGAEFTTTIGNNVRAQDDTNGNNGIGVSPDGGSALNFDFPLNLNNAPSTFLPAATTNLFYWNNIIHDITYQYGFNEASGNFQENNYGKGGAGSDSVNADAQDGSGTNNANFATPPDGSNPRMQMFLFTNPTRDGDLDNVIIAHEYGHGVSTRLVGGPSTNALGGSEQMGEGWSDWLGLILTIRPGDTRNTARGVGTYAIGQATDGGGIRPTRYSTDTAVNGTDYNDISGLSVPHGVGYAFATILWDMTWDLIDLEGYDSNLYTGTGGNNIAMALVIEGLKNTANNPGFVSGRDGILQADQDLYGGQYNCLIWDAFAKRGVGVDAVENTNGGTNTNNDQTASFTSGCSSPPPPITCDTTIASFPYSEGFENTLGSWSQDTGDDFNWTLNTGGTPSNNTGPTGAFEGTYYVYVEASSPNFGGKNTILNSPCFNLTGLTNPTANFHYQMIGNAVGTIRLEVRVDGAQTWTEIWSQTGDQGINWVGESVSLSAYVGETIQLRYRATTGTSWQGDIAIDAFNITSTTVDTEAPSIPLNLVSTGITQTTVDLSWDASTDNVAVTAYEVFQGNTSLGDVTNTTMQVTGLTANTAYAFRVRAKDAAGNNSGFSNTLNVTTNSTPPPGGCLNGVNSLPYGESFEADFGLWTQATGDDLNWTRDSGGTPSNGTGPSSGADGAFYVYVEASVNGTGYPNKRAILNSPCFDLTTQTEATFIFNNHMFGSTDGGRVDLEASSDDGATWTSLWNQTGNQGNQWNTVSINLSAYVGGSVQLRFNRVTGGTWQSDFALDNARLIAGGGNSGCVGGETAPYNEGFESSIGLWTQASGDDLNWTRDSGGTPSNGTGPSTGSEGASYMYVEASSNGTGFPNKRAILNSPCLDLNGASSAAFAFDYHMFGSTDGGRIDLEASNDNGATWTSIWNQTGNQGNQWNAVFLDISAYVGSGLQLRFNRITGGTWQSDVAIDNINLTTSTTFNALTTGGAVTDSSTTFDIKIYPNPVKGELLNVSTFTENLDYKIYNMLGQVVSTGKLKGSSINVSNLEAAVYVVEFSNESNKMTKRFIKE